MNANFKQNYCIYNETFAIKLCENNKPYILMSKNRF